MRKQTPSMAQGLSLVEVLIALLIFSVTMLTSGFMALKSLSLARDGFYQIKATDLAQMQQEAILANGLKDIQAWQKRVEQALPQGEGHIVAHKGPDGHTHLIHIQVAWQPHYFNRAPTQKQVISIPFIYHESLI